MASKIMQIGSLDHIKPEGWNNIPIPLCDAIKIIVNEITKLKKVTTQSNFMIQQNSKSIESRASDAAMESKAISNDLRKTEDSLKNLIEM